MQRPGQLKPAVVRRGQDRQVELEVVADLGAAAVGKHRPQDPDQVVEPQLTGQQRTLLVPVTAGQVPGLAVADAQAHPDQVRAQGVERIGLGVHGHEVDAFEPLGQPVQAGRVVHQVEAGGVDARCGQILLEQRVELQLGVQGAQPVDVRFLHPVALDLGGHLGGVVEAHQVAGQEGLLTVVEQLADGLALLHPRGGLVEVFQGVMLADQLLCRFRADAGHAGNVVRAVAGKGEIVEQLTGRQAVLLRHRRLVHHPVIHRVPQGHVGRDQLEQILVAGNDHHPAPLPGHAGGHRGDQVVRLLVVVLEHEDPVSGHTLADVRDLHGQILGHGRPVGLVLVVEPVAEDRPPGVEGHGQVPGAALAQQAPQDAEKAEDGVGRQPARGGQWPDGVIGAVDVGAAVDQVQFRGGHELSFRADVNSARAAAPGRQWWGTSWIQTQQKTLPEGRVDRTRQWLPSGPASGGRPGLRPDPPGPRWPAAPCRPLPWRTGPRRLRRYRSSPHRAGRWHGKTRPVCRR